jgi:hypothetical protein
MKRRLFWTFVIAALLVLALGGTIARGLSRA